MSQGGRPFPEFEGTFRPDVRASLRAARPLISQAPPPPTAERDRQAQPKWPHQVSRLLLGPQSRAKVRAKPPPCHDPRPRAIAEPVLRMPGLASSHAQPRTNLAAPTCPRSTATGIYSTSITGRSNKTRRCLPRRGVRLMTPPPATRPPRGPL